jgi:hypothetical protein
MCQRSRQTCTTHSEAVAKAGLTMAVTRRSWQSDLQGVDHLGRADRAELLVDYLQLSEKQLLEAVDRLGGDGKWELAASLLDSCRSRFARSESVAKAERLVYLKLMEKNQNTDPFKFILYSAKIGEQAPQMSDHAQEPRDRSAVHNRPAGPTRLVDPVGRSPRRRTHSRMRVPHHHPR